MARPSKIVVIRHAEKPTRDEDQHLSAEGKARARYLVQYIPETFGNPDYIFATEITKMSARPVMTVTPLWDALPRTTLDASVPDEDATHLGHHIVHHGHWDDQFVLICWHHGKIPDLLDGIGLKHHEYPDPWPEDDFDTVFEITFEHDEPVVTKHKMKQLHG